MYAAISDVVPDAAFTLFTGDMIDHAIWNTSQEYNEAESMYPQDLTGQSCPELTGLKQFNVSTW